jgi:hypothetical protein
MSLLELAFQYSRLQAEEIDQTIRLTHMKAFSSVPFFNSATEAGLKNLNPCS